MSNKQAELEKQKLNPLELASLMAKRQSLGRLILNHAEEIGGLIIPLMRLYVFLPRTPTLYAVAYGVQLCNFF